MTMTSEGFPYLFQRPGFKHVAFCFYVSDYCENNGYGLGPGIERNCERLGVKTSMGLESLPPYVSRAMDGFEQICKEGLDFRPTSWNAEMRAVRDQMREKFEKRHGGDMDKLCEKLKDMPPPPKVPAGDPSPQSTPEKTPQASLRIAVGQNLHAELAEATLNIAKGFIGDFAALHLRDMYTMAVGAVQSVRVSISRPVISPSIALRISPKPTTNVIGALMTVILIGPSGIEDMMDSVNQYFVRHNCRSNPTGDCVMIMGPAML